MAILDQMVNPHGPHLPKRNESYENEEEKEGIEGAWNTITDDPLEYHFFYHILDGNEGGRPPKIVASGWKEKITNKYFNRRDKSCLHMIAKSYNKVRLRTQNLFIKIVYFILLLRRFSLLTLGGFAASCG